MDSDLLRMLELDSMLKLQIAKTSSFASQATGLDAAATATGDAIGRPPSPPATLSRQNTRSQSFRRSKSLELLQHDFDSCCTEMATATKTSLDISHYDEIRADPSQLAFACELLYKQVLDEPLLRGFFEHVDTGRLQTMVNSAVIKCVYQEKLDDAYVKRLEKTHRELDISDAAYASYLSLFEESMAKAGVDEALRHRLHRMLADLKRHIVSEHMRDISEGEEDDSLLHDDMFDSLSQLQVGGSAGGCPFSRR